MRNAKDARIRTSGKRSSAARRHHAGDGRGPGAVGGVRPTGRATGPGAATAGAPGPSCAAAAGAAGTDCAAAGGAGASCAGRAEAHRAAIQRLDGALRPSERAGARSLRNATAADRQRGPYGDGGRGRQSARRVRPRPADHRAARRSAARRRDAADRQRVGGAAAGQPLRAAGLPYRDAAQAGPVGPLQVGQPGESLLRGVRSARRARGSWASRFRSSASRPL